MGKSKEESWSIRLTENAEKMFLGIEDRRVREQVGKRIDALKKSPELQGKPLLGELKGYRSVRAVGQRYRIIYSLERMTVTVLVVAVGLRKDGDKSDVYRLAQKLLRLKLL